MKCRKCHSEIPVNSKFCPYCGTELKKKVKKVVNSQNTTPFEIITKYICTHKKGTITLISAIIMVPVAFSYISNHIEK